MLIITDIIMNQDLDHLIALLDDNDPQVFRAVRSELQTRGLEVIPQLEKIWELSTSAHVQERMETLIHSIQFTYTRNNLRSWVSAGAASVLEGATYVAQLQYPHLKLSEVVAEIAKIAGDVYLSAGNHLTAYEKVKLLNYVIFDLNNFNRNTANYYSPQNSFINQVIESRKGNPISLGIVYLAVAQKLELPIYGVNLPKCFVLAYMNEYRHSNDIDLSNDVLFYVNPYNKGSVLNRKDIDEFIAQQQLKVRSEFYVPCDNQSIIQRLILNLMIAYEKMGFEEKNEPLKELLSDFQLQKG